METIEESGEEDGSPINNQPSSEVASASFDFASAFDMGDYSAVDMDEVALESVPEEVPVKSSNPKPPQTPAKNSKPNKPPPPPPLNLPLPPKPKKSNSGNLEEKRGSLLDEIRNNNRQLRKSSINEKRSPQTRESSLRDILMGSMIQIRNVRNTDYGVLEEAYSVWDDDDE